MLVVRKVRCVVGNKVSYRAPDGVLTGKAFSCGSLRDEGHVGVAAIGCCEVAACNERTLNGEQIFGVYPSDVDRRLLAGGYGMIRTSKVIHPGLAGERRHAGEGNGLHTGQLMQSGESAVGKVQ